MPDLVADIVLGDTISCRSKALNDNNEYHGKIVGIVDSTVAKTFDDIHTKNTQVRTQDATVPEDVTLLTFFMIQLLDKVDGVAKFQVPFAKEWIDEATLDIITTQSRLDLTVYDAGDANVQSIVDLLRSAGFKASVTKVY